MLVKHSRALAGHPDHHQLEGVLDRDELVNEVTVTSVQVNQAPPQGVRLEPLDI
jgi:hypothetical protein